MSKKATGRPVGGPNSKAVWWIALALFVVCAVAAAAVFIYVRVTEKAENVDATPAPALITAHPSVRAVNGNAPVPTAALLQKYLRGQLNSKNLGQLHGIISDALTGEVLWQKQASVATTPASTTKLLTAAAALLAMPHTKRLVTRVVAGASPGQLILVGAGDPTLTVQPKGARSLFTDAPRLADLAEAIKESGVAVTSIAVDNSAITGSNFETSWDKADIAGGNVSPIVGVIADSGRISPMELDSPRTADPARAAGKALASYLGISTPITEVKADAGAKEIAQVQSATLKVRLRDMVQLSDNVLAETVGVELAKYLGSEPTLDSGREAVLKILNQNGFDTSALTIDDVNGLSSVNKITPNLLNSILLQASGEKEPKLRELLDMLAIGAVNGTLASRFSEANTVGAGWVRAKTGTLASTSALAGVVLDVDHRLLVFALMSTGTSPDQARPALDAIAARLRLCGCK